MIIEHFFNRLADEKMLLSDRRPNPDLIGRWRQTGHGKFYQMSLKCMPQLAWHMKQQKGAK